MTEKNHYVVDPELMAEMVRLKGQGELLTKNMKGVLPELSEEERSPIHDVLDLACGPGEWALELAFEYPDLHVMGVDISENMIDYARAQAQAYHLNADFQVMNILEYPLFPDGVSFDLVNMRLVFGFLFPAQWPLLLEECMRLLRPGGILRVTECERPLSNNELFERYEYLWTRAFFRDHRAFSTDGHHYSLHPALKLMLKQTGFTQLQHISYMVDISADAETHEAFFNDLLSGVRVGMPFLQKMACDSSELEELEHLYDKLDMLVNQDGFCAYWPLMTFLGKKPGTSVEGNLPGAGG